MTLEFILLSLTLFFSAMAAYFMFRSAQSADTLKDATEDFRKLKLRMDIFEDDFSEKFDHFVKKAGSRERMRKKREEESEDSNNPEVLIPI